MWRLTKENKGQKLWTRFWSNATIFKKFGRSRQSSDCLRIFLNKVLYIENKNINRGGDRIATTGRILQGHSNLNRFLGIPVCTYIKFTEREIPHPHPTYVSTLLIFYTPMSTIDLQTKVISIELSIWNIHWFNYRQSLLIARRRRRFLLYLASKALKNMFFMPQPYFPSQNIQKNSMS